jgi:UV DNA damage endonuclease
MITFKLDAKEMKIGYPCINLSLPCRSSRTFRLKNYSEEKLIETIEGNLQCLRKILEYNKQNKIYFFRITSDLIPFASHPIMEFDWQVYFKEKLSEIGKFIKENKMRITMHPGQYTLLNSPNDKVFETSIKDLEYHVEILDLMELDKAAKVQIHVGGVYGDKKRSRQRFIERYRELPAKIKNRLIIENDEKSYGLKDCLYIHEKTGIPIVFDMYHHECLNSGETLEEAFKLFMKTWVTDDGPPIIHYSSEHPVKGKPRHADSINILHFKDFLKKAKNFDFDIMLEIKDKEKSALEAIKLITFD